MKFSVSLIFLAGYVAALPVQPVQQDSRVRQKANSGNTVVNSGSGGYISNGNTHAGGKNAVAAPQNYAQGTNNEVKSGKATNNNAGSTFGDSRVKQKANSGNYVSNSGSGGWLENGDTSANGGRHGQAYAIPINIAGGTNNHVESGDATNNNGIPALKRDLEERTVIQQPESRVRQGANSGNTVTNWNSGGTIKNGNTHASGKNAVAQPVNQAQGTNNNVGSGKATNNNRGAGLGDSRVKQHANSGNTVINENSGGWIENGDTSAEGRGRHGTAQASPQNIAGGTNNVVSSGDATNNNQKRTLEERTNAQQPESRVRQGANSGNTVTNWNSGGSIKNGNTHASGKNAVARPVNQAQGTNNNVSSGKATNSNAGASLGDSRVKQHANSGNTVINENSGGWIENGDTSAEAHGRHGTAQASPQNSAGGTNNVVSSGDAENNNGGARRVIIGKRDDNAVLLFERTNERGSNRVKQSSNSGNTVVNEGSGGYIVNGDTKSGGLVGVAVPVNVAGGTNNNVHSGNSSNNNSGSSSGRNKVKQSSNSGNTVENYNSGGQIHNGDTEANGKLVGVAVPVNYAGGTNNVVVSGDSKNQNGAVPVCRM